MRWSPKKLLMLALFLCVFLLISSVEASYYLRKDAPIRYFPSKSGSYIHFDSSVLPLSFNTLYKDGDTRWHFNNYWIRTDADLSISKYFRDQQLIVTVSKASGNSTFELGGVVNPTRVLIDGDLPANYTFSDGVLIVTVSHASAHQIFVDWSAPVEPPTEPSPPSPPPTWDEEEEPLPWTPPPLVTPPPKPFIPMPFELGVAIIIVCVLASVIYSQVRKGPSVKQGFKRKTEAKQSSSKKRRQKTK